MNNEQLIQKIIDQLDQSMEQGSGHVRIQVEATALNAEQTAKTADLLVESVCRLPFLDCDQTAMACSSPTLMEGLDDKEERP